MCWKGPASSSVKLGRNSGKRQLKTQLRLSLPKRNQKFNWKWGKLHVVGPLVAMAFPHYFLTTACSCYTSIMWIPMCDFAVVYFECAAILQSSCFLLGCCNISLTFYPNLKFCSVAQIQIEVRPQVDQCSCFPFESTVAITFPLLHLHSFSFEQLNHNCCPKCILTFASALIFLFPNLRFCPGLLVHIHVHSTSADTRASTSAAIFHLSSCSLLAAESNPSCHIVHFSLGSIPRSRF